MRGERGIIQDNSNCHAGKICFDFEVINQRACSIFMHTVRFLSISRIRKPMKTYLCETGTGPFKGDSPRIDKFLK